MYTLGIDTSNYATSLAVFDTAAEEVVCDRKRFLPVKPGELGLRQSDAVFHHTAALPELLRELDAEFPLHRVDAVGVSEKPRPVEGSYMPCFLTGLAVAQGLALARGVLWCAPLINRGISPPLCSPQRGRRFSHGACLCSIFRAEPPSSFCAAERLSCAGWAAAPTFMPARRWTASA